jgi:hypothetical protein
VPVWYVAPLEMNEGTHWGQGYNRSLRLQCRRRPNKATLEYISLFGTLSISVLMGDPEDTEFLSDKLAVFSKVVYFRTLVHNMTVREQRMT